MDAVVKKTDDECTLVTFGCSAIKVTGRPYVEAFGKCKGKDDESVKYVDNLIRIACGVKSESPASLECQLLNGFEYMFLDHDDWYHEKDGYWGFFIAPMMTCKPKGWNDVEFYQIIPAFKEELDFIEQNPKVDYHELCKEIVRALPNRQYLNEKSAKLSAEELDAALKAAEKRIKQEQGKKTEAPSPKKAKKEREVVRLGSYEWLVIKQDKEKMLMITKEVIACRPYNDELCDCSWETCTLRTWLNSTFLEEFSEAERDRVLTTTVLNPPNAYGRYKGRDTEDGVFLLSTEETKRWFRNAETRRCYPNERAIAEGQAFSQYGCMWWLRTTGASRENAVCVSGEYILEHGPEVNEKHGIRPAMWVKK